jgi:hypothetical protein
VGEDHLSVWPIGFEHGCSKQPVHVRIGQDAGKYRNFFLAQRPHGHAFGPWAAVNEGSVMASRYDHERGRMG